MKRNVVSSPGALHLLDNKLTTPSCFNLIGPQKLQILRSYLTEASIDIPSYSSVFLWIPPISIDM